MRRRSHQRRTGSALIQRIGIAVVLALTLTVFRDSLRVDSGSISRDTPEQLSITGGVLTIAPGADGDSVMELGNNGNEIISTGDINIRPNGSFVGTRFVGNADQTSDLLLSGKLDVRGGITLGGVRRTTWPFVDHWKTVQGSGGGTTLMPSEAAISLSTGSQQTNDTGIAGLSLYANDGTSESSALFVGNNGSGDYAANFNNTDVTVYGDLSYYSMYVCGSTLATPAARAAECHANGSLYKIGWTKDNMYHSGGIDADTLDGVDTYFVGNCNGQQGAHCICTSMPAGTSRCATLTNPVHAIP